jgi:hypothetical protein
MVPEQLEANDWTSGDNDGGGEVPLEIIAHHSSKVRIPRVA